MNYNKVINQLRSGGMISVLEEMGALNAIQLKREAGPDGKPRYRIGTFESVRVTNHTKQMMVHLNKKMNLVTSVELLVLSKALGNGPKILCLDQMQCEALENTELNFRIGEYSQPFDTMVIELPADYIKNRQVDCLQGGNIRFDGSVVPSIHEPLIAVVHHEPTLLAILISIFMSSEQVFSVLLYEKDEEMLEEILDWTIVKGKDIGNIEVSGSENVMMNNIAHLALNACMVVDSLGYQKLGPANKDYYDRLERKLASGSAKNKKETIKELQSIPMLYSISQNVELYDRVSEPNDTQHGTGGTVGPHWRRSHWRKQACGPKYQDHKRIRIKSVLVNAKMFAGSLSNATATYKMK